MLVEQHLHVEHFIKFFLEGLPRGIVFPGTLVGSVELVAHGWRILVYFSLIPALLQVISTVVVATISVTESDILDVVRQALVCARREVVFRVMHKQGVTARKDVDKHRLAATVWSHDGNLLAIVKRKVDRLCHTPLRHAHHAVFYIDNWSTHIFIVFLILEQVPCKYLILNSSKD